MLFSRFWLKSKKTRGIKQSNIALWNTSMRIPIKNVWKKQNQQLKCFLACISNILNLKLIKMKRTIKQAEIPYSLTSKMKATLWKNLEKCQQIEESTWRKTSSNLMKYSIFIKNLILRDSKTFRIAISVWHFREVEPSQLVTRESSKLWDSFTEILPLPVWLDLQQVDCWPWP